jgi:hypothetical protein
MPTSHYLFRYRRLRQIEQPSACPIERLHPRVPIRQLREHRCSKMDLPAHSENRNACSLEAGKRAYCLVPLSADRHRIQAATALVYASPMFEKREDNTAYLLEATISKLQRLEGHFKTLSDSHRQFVEEQFPRLLVEAVSKAERTGSKERIDRLSLIIVHTVVEGPTADLQEVDEMMRLTLDISDADIDVLGKIYAKQAQGLSFLKYMPDQNVANSTWKELEDTHAIFKSSEIYSICAKLQSFGLVTQVPRIRNSLPTVKRLSGKGYR